MVTMDDFKLGDDFISNTKKLEICQQFSLLGTVYDLLCVSSSDLSCTPPPRGLHFCTNKWLETQVLVVLQLAS